MSLRSFTKFAVMLLIFVSAWTQAIEVNCCQSFEVALGWRRDYIKWHAHRIEASSPISDLAIARSDFDFDHMESYMISSKIHWVGEAFYIRLYGDYGQTFKGEGEELFGIIASPLVGGNGQLIHTHFDAGIKRRSEVWDITGAVGYPYVFCNKRAYVVPLIGFSYHRQRIRVKSGEDPLSTTTSHEHEGDIFGDCFDVDQLGFNDFTSSCSVSSSFELFEPESVPPIEAIGLKPKELKGSMHRITWYGFFVGLDAAYALDSDWTLFTELEYHFCDRCHRKRHSHTAIGFVDDYHAQGYAHGFNGTTGVVVELCNDWYFNFTVDYKWWRSKEKHDTVSWNSVGANAAVGIIF